MKSKLGPLIFGANGDVILKHTFEYRAPFKDGFWKRGSEGCDLIREDWLRGSMMTTGCYMSVEKKLKTY